MARRSKKVARTGITREKDFLYYVKGGDVWRVARKQPGRPKGRPEKVAEGGIEMDTGGFMYFVDKDGDICRAPRSIGGQKRKRKKAAKKKATKKKAAKKKAAKKKAPKKKAAKKKATKKKAPKKKAAKKKATRKKAARKKAGRR